MSFRWLAASILIFFSWRNEWKRNDFGAGIQTIQNFEGLVADRDEQMSNLDGHLPLEMSNWLGGAWAPASTYQVIVVFNYHLTSHLSEIRLLDISVNWSLSKSKLILWKKFPTKKKSIDTSDVKQWNHGSVLGKMPIF